MQGIKISVSYVGARSDITLITILGYVDTTTCHELTRVIKKLILEKHYLIIADLGGVSYISSAGWGVFMGEIKDIRDKGGDLKIVQMSPEVFEVFEMLEFNRILNYYDSLEEAIDEVDIVRGIDITIVDESIKRKPRSGVTGMRYPSFPTVVKNRTGNSGKSSDRVSLPVKDFPVMEKIKMIVIENPFPGIRGIRKQLKNEKYGKVRLGWFQVRSILKKLNLETKDKRYRFYRSR